MPQRGFKVAAAAAMTLCLFFVAGQSRPAGEKGKRVPLVGDETPLVKLIAEPNEYCGQRVTIVGGLSISEHYEPDLEIPFTARDGSRMERIESDPRRKTHYSLAFREVNADGVTTGRNGYVYLARDTGQPLVDAIVEATKNQKLTYKLARLSVSVDKTSQFEAEVLGWQLLNADGTEWLPWVETQQRRAEQHAALVVWWTGGKATLYHTEDCKLMKQSPHPERLSLGDAQAKRLKPCKRCSPPE
jgi:hypothetical protein